MVLHTFSQYCALLAPLMWYAASEIISASYTEHCALYMYAFISNSSFHNITPIRFAG